MREPLTPGEFKEFVLDIAHYRQWLDKGISWQNCALRRGGGVAIYVRADFPVRLLALNSRDAYRLDLYGHKPDKARPKTLHPSSVDVVPFAHCAGYRGAPLELTDAERKTVPLGTRGPVNGFDGVGWLERLCGPVPPKEVFDRTTTPLDVKRYPRFFFTAGYSLTTVTRCDHGYFLNSSCAGCDADEENRRGAWEGVDELGYTT